MSNLVTVTCWSCERQFQVRLERQPPEPVYRGIKPVAQPGGKENTSGQIAKECPYCGKTNIIEL